jgi:hypothetical protein
MTIQNIVLILICLLLLCCNKPSNNETKQLEVSNQTLNLGVAGTKDSFTIQSNVNWQITSSASWLSLSATSGSNNSKIYVTATQNNTSGNTISASITITPVGTTNIQPVVVTVRQSYEKLSTQWTKLYRGSASDTVYYMTKTNDGGFVLAGNSESNDGDLLAGYGDAVGSHGGQDYFVLKVDGSGNKQWSKVFGGSGDEKARSVIATTDGGYIVAGERASADGDLMNLAKGAWIIKLDGAGNKQWSKTYGGSGVSYAYCLEAQVDTRRERQRSLSHLFKLYACDAITFKLFLKLLANDNNIIRFT